MIYSFDIFDTCLIRTCGLPYFAFEILARRVMPNADETQIFDFALVRKEGESLARKKYTSEDKEDVTIEEIYSCCDFSRFDIRYSTQDIINMELLVEREVLTPVHAMQEQINKLRNAGNQILYISDMYLPSDFIHRLMVDNGFIKNEDYLFVSCEYGKTKHSGNLFQIIKEHLGLDYCQWKHYGDNKHSDYNIPKKLGIKTELVNHNMAYYEKRLSRMDYTSRVQSSKIMASIAKAVRLKKCNDIQYSFAADLIAPVFVPFVYNVLHDAEKRGINKLFFLARDAYVFYRIAKVLQKQFPSISVSYIYVSRNSLYLPGLKEISFESLSSLFTKIDWQDIDDILVRLHMYDMKDYVLNIIPSEVKDTNRIIDILLNDDIFVNELRKKHAEQRRNILEYFKSEGLGDEHSAIVDLTGTRRCHEAINNVLEQDGLHGVFGYYFEVLSERLKGNGYKSYNFYERYELTSKRYTIGPHDLFEQYHCISPHKRTYEYAMTEDCCYVPVFECDLQDEKYKKKISDINITVCEDFAEKFLTVSKIVDTLKCGEDAMAISTEFFRYPQKEYLMAVRDCMLSDSCMRGYKLLSERSILSILKNRAKSPWLYGNIIFNSNFPDLWRQILMLKSKMN